ncbi:MULTISPECIES: TetR/AcrR family transcriptional regulator [unclassified Sphingomonas]|jgi:AcrR family transcriptional regulator|uniref:TetR/AcrR family transcriptional regulator n=1 Tax=unclassified Sphingomonas TaxID=196159 RepID=UPI00082FD3A5|nr:MULTISPECIES: TetR/AcrR family transcriptional regulator [unclassified Sphingomonas]
MNRCAKPDPRPRNAAATRDAILDHARRLFARDSYEQVGLRDIAGGAGIDAALVCRYFGSKEELFKTALRGDDEDLFAGVDRAGLAKHLVDMVTDADGDADHDQRDSEAEQLMIMLRSASSPRAAAIVSEAVRDELIEPIAALIDRPDARTRALLCLVTLLGYALIDPVLDGEALTNERPALTPAMHDLLEHILGG